MWNSSGIFVVTLAICCLATQVSADRAVSVSQSDRSAADSPALAAAGNDSVGFRKVEFEILADPSKQTPARRLPLAIWYPAQPQLRSPPSRRGRLRGDANQHGLQACYKIPTPSAGGSIPAGLPPTIGDCGHAIVDADPKIGTKLPVILLSHGLNGWATGWSQLGENLASKGYVVIAIDHGDRDPIGEGGINRAFGEAVLYRSVDQRGVLRALQQMASAVPAPAPLPAWLTAISNGTDVALIGYSMGGYGALISAGAGLSPTSALTAAMPSAAITPLLAGNPIFEQGKPSNLRALILIAPFGGAMPFRAWTAEGLSRVKLPTLIVSGDEDDIVDYKGGVRWLFDSLAGADRHLLTYQNARHNVAMDPTPSQVRHLFVYRERFDESVWRPERIQAINAHIFTAFLDANLKGDAQMAGLLKMPTVRAVDGQWPLSPNQSVGAKTATTDQQPNYWPGFQRRWAMGLTFESRDAQDH